MLNILSSFNVIFKSIYVSSFPINFLFWAQKTQYKSTDKVRIYLLFCNTFIHNFIISIQFPQKYHSEVKSLLKQSGWTACYNMMWHLVPFFFFFLGAKWGKLAHINTFSRCLQFSVLFGISVGNTQMEIDSIIKAKLIYADWGQQFVSRSLRFGAEAALMWNKVWCR